MQPSGRRLLSAQNFNSSVCYPILLNSVVKLICLSRGRFWCCQFSLQTVLHARLDQALQHFVHLFGGVRHFVIQPPAQHGYKRTGHKLSDDRDRHSGLLPLGQACLKVSGELLASRTPAPFQRTTPDHARASSP